jgi:hypothetical protein
LPDGDGVQAIDLETGAPLWARSYGRYEDRLACSPDGERLFVPLREDARVVVADATTGAPIRDLAIEGRPHNALVSPDGRRLYVASLTNPVLYEVDLAGGEAVRRIGPFSNGIRPFTVDPAGGRVYVNVDRLLGFEVGDLGSGAMLSRVEVAGFAVPEWRKAYHLTPSHGLSLSPDGRELWVVNSNGYLHVFDVTASAPRQVASLQVTGDPGWLTHSLDGAHLYAATGEVIDVRTRRTIAGLPPSEKVLEVVTSAGRVVEVGDQFGMGRAPVTGPRTLVVGLDRHHSGGTYAFEDTSEVGFSRAGEWLRSKGHALRAVTSAFDAASLAGLDVLLVVNPDKHGAKVAAGEAAALHRWVEAGGVAFLLGNRADAYDVEALNQLAAPFRLSFTREILKTAGDLVAPLPAHPFFAGCQELTIHNFNAVQASPPAAEVLRASVPGAGDKVLLAVARIGRGAVFALGDSWLYNRVFDAPVESRWKSRDNLRMLENVLRWVGEVRGAGADAVARN